MTGQRQKYGAIYVVSAAQYDEHRDVYDKALLTAGRLTLADKAPAGAVMDETTLRLVRGDVVPLHDDEAPTYAMRVSAVFDISEPQP